MQEFISNFHFLRPWYLLLLLVPLFLYWRYFRGINNKSSWENVCDRKLLDFLLIKGSSTLRRFSVYVALTGFLFAVIAIAGPSWQKKEIPNMIPENPVMILLNMSSDMQETDLSPNRLNRAKFKITDLLNSLKSIQAGLVVYSNEPFLVSPITEDTSLIKNLMPAINFDIMPSNGDRLDRAIAYAVQKFKNAGFNKGSIIIFTPDVGQRFDLAIEEAQKAKALNYDVSVEAVNQESVEKLQLIAKNGGGIYTNITPNDNDIRKLTSEIEQHMDDLKLSKNVKSTWEDFGYYITIIPLLCCLYFFRKGMAVVIFMLMSINQAQAGFFLNNNQEGLKAFNAGDYQQAAGKFEETNWKASSLYRLGEFDKANELFLKDNSETGLYNQGNALAKGGKIEEAIKKYEEVLKINPDNEDAKFNLEYLKKMQQNQNQQNNQDNKDNQQDQQNEQNQNSSDDNQDKDKNNQNQEQNQQQDSKSQENESKDNQSQNGENQQDKNQEQKQDQNSEAQQDQDKKDDGKSKAQQQQEQQQPSQKDDKPQDKPEQKGSAELQKGYKDNKYDEEIQAREQQFREIPEDTGGLLRAFIKKEYMQGRYKD